MKPTPEERAERALPHHLFRSETGRDSAIASIVVEIHEVEQAKLEECLPFMGHKDDCYIWTERGSPACGCTCKYDQVVGD